MIWMCLNIDCNRHFHTAYGNKTEEYEQCIYLYFSYKHLGVRKGLKPVCSGLSIWICGVSSESTRFAEACLSQYWGLPRGLEKKGTCSFIFREQGNIGKFWGTGNKEILKIILREQCWLFLRNKGTWAPFPWEGLSASGIYGNTSRIFINLTLSALFKIFSRRICFLFSLEK